MSAETLSLDIQATLSEFDFNVSETLTLDGATAIFGPSGAGKTMLMRLIAGFEQPRTGRISMGDSVWFDAEANLSLPAWARPVGYMFQDARLFSHLNVRGNLTYADTRSSRANQAFHMDEIIHAFDLAPLLYRRTHDLSGGERQRAALARTLLSRPSLLLLDEPLAALDRTRKNAILPYLKNLPERFGIPTLFVSHDIEEVSQLADHIVLLNSGTVEAYGGTTDIVSRMNLEPLTGRYDASTLLDAIISSHDRRLHLTFVQFGGATISLPLNERLQLGERVRLLIRAQDVALATEEPHHISIRNALAGIIHDLSTADNSPFAEVVIDIQSTFLRARITRAALEDLNLSAGMAVYALIKSVTFDSRPA